MALDSKYCQTSTTVTCTPFTITDQTGLYDVNSNLGGYGGINPARADLALYMIGYKYRESTDDENITALINNSDPNNVEYWEIPNSEDGYYYFNVLAVNVWDAAISYAVGDLVFYQQVFYKALAINLNSAPSDINTDWEEVADMEDETENTSLVNNTRYDMVFTCRIEACYGKIVHDSEAICAGCTDCTGQSLQLYMRLDGLFQSVFIHIDQDNWAKADKIVRLMIGFCKKTNCRVC